MTNELSPSASKVQLALAKAGFSLQVIELPGSTRTAVEAAQAVGCTVGQIVKSLVFRALQSDRPVWFGSGKAKATALGREGWLKVLIATVIALSVGVIVALFVLPYGAAMAFGALSVTFITLILSLPKLFE